MQEILDRLVLASQSPRRREMLAWLGLPFRAVEAAVNEDPLPEEAPAALALRLARAKACAGNGLAAHSLVLSADTVVELEGASLGKPADAEEAWDMLTALRGKDHAVHTGVALWNPQTDRLSLRIVTTVVTMRAYSDAEIAAYIGTGDPFDKAGAYAIQHTGFSPVARLERCYANVVGLPLCAVLALLAESAGSAPEVHALALCRARFGYTCPGPDWGESCFTEGPRL
ncbi:MAG: Maf family protein [Anaerolineae bacterium]|jgi:MAF protein|nr:Maf family protein [Anaerolineae bacterium]